MDVELDLISPDPNQPRKVFDEDALNELELSIREHGVLQPIAVRPVEGGRYVIVAGERRWRASRRAGLEKIPVHVLEGREEVSIMEAALIENIQRQDLNPVEEAIAYKALVEKLGSVQAVAKKVGKSRPSISNAMRILALSEDLIFEIRAGRLSAAHATNLLSIKDAALRERLGRLCISNKWTVKDLQDNMNLDYSLLDEVSDEETLLLKKNSKKAIMIEFELEDYDEALLLVKKVKKEEKYFGGFFLRLLKEAVKP